MARSFESNGPDVKIRGTAAHIAEKYTTLARDAAAVGDIVQAENYLQHAEHYNRIIMAAQAQQGPGPQPSQEGANGAGGGGQRHRRGHGYDEGARMAGDFAGDEGDDTGVQRGPDFAAVETSGGRADDRRRRPNGADGDDDADSRTSSEDAPDNVVA